MERFLIRAMIVALLVMLGAGAGAQLSAYNWVTGLGSGCVQMVQDPNDPTVKYIVIQSGRIRVVKDGVALPTDFLNITPLIFVPGPPPDSLGERGLLGLEFAPDYASSGHFYVNYVDRTSAMGNTQISRFTRSSTNPLVADPASEFKILNVFQPYPNHKGGTLRFGPDGYLYIGMGDGGNGNDPGNRAQNPAELLGKMLRIDPTGDDFPGDPNTNYRIPPDNPYLDGNPVTFWNGSPVTARGEIWAFGLRNPYRWSFDRASLGGTNAMLIADVGQNTWEEISYEPAGVGARNYGWRVREGAHTIVGGTPSYTPLKDPIHEYPRGTGGAVTGGYVYRGPLLGPTYQGRYFFADFSQRRVWSFGITIGAGGEGTQTPGSLIEHTTELGGMSFISNLSSIDIDNNGELYLLAYSGRIIRVIPAGPINVAPSSVTKIIGNIPTQGGVAEVQTSNDQYYIVPGDKNAISGPSVRIEVEGISARMASTRIAIRTESNFSRGTQPQTIEAFRYTDSTWVLIDSSTIGTTDTVRNPVITASPSSFIQPGTGKVKLRISIGNTGANSRQRASFDHVQWTIDP